MNQFRGFRSGIGLALLIGAIVAGAAAYGQGKVTDPIFTDTFEADTAGWTALGPHSKVEQATESADVKSGKGALRFRYQVGEKPGEKPPPVTSGLPVDALMRPTPGGKLAGMQALGFWARSDIAAPFLLALSEKDGGRYVTIVWLPAGQWQRVTLQPSDFWLSDDKTDPKDPDGKLDLDQVENVALIDAYSFFVLAAGDTPESVSILSPLLGPHTLLLDDFTVYASPQPVEAPEPALPAKTRGLWVEDLRRSTLAWFLLGKAEMRIDPEAPFKGRAIRLDYIQGEGQYVIIAHDIHRFNLAKLDRLTFEVASAKSMKLVVQLEEKSGAKYNAIIDIPGDSQPTRKSISFSGFTIADDSPKDPDGQLDLDQLKTLTFVDITGAFGLDKQKNTLWIGPIRAISLNL